jgi:hypothetical protein
MRQQAAPLRLPCAAAPCPSAPASSGRSWPSMARTTPLATSSLVAVSAGVGAGRQREGRRCWVDRRAWSLLRLHTSLPPPIPTAHPRARPRAGAPQQGFALQAVVVAVEACIHGAADIQQHHQVEARAHLRGRLAGQRAARLHQRPADAHMRSLGLGTIRQRCSRGASSHARTQSVIPLSSPTARNTSRASAPAAASAAPATTTKSLPASVAATPASAAPWRPAASSGSGARERE